MQLKTKLIIITIFLTTSPLLYSDSTSVVVDTTYSKSESQLVENIVDTETNGFSVTDIEIEHVFSLLIILLMWMTWKNAKKSSIVQERLVDVQELNVNVQTQMADIHNQNVDIQQQIAESQKTNVEIQGKIADVQKTIADIQETNIKINVLPEIKKILSGLDGITQFSYFSSDVQMDSNRKYSEEISNLIFYFNEDDDVYKIVKTLWDKLWEMTGSIGERESIMIRKAIKTEEEQFKKLSKDIAGQAKIIFDDIQKIKIEIIKRFQINMK